MGTTGDLHTQDDDQNPGVDMDVTNMAAGIVKSGGFRN